MNKFPALLLVFALLTGAGDSIFAQARFGLTAGYNHANMLFSEDYTDLLEFVGSKDLNTKALPGYHIGVTAAFGIGPNFGIGTGLQLDRRGARQVFSGVVLNIPYTETRSIAPLYVRMPLLATFNSRGFYVAAGPYASFAVAGKIKTKTESAGASTETSEDIDFGSEEGNDLNRIDYGAQFELGYEFFDHLRVGIRYDLGLANILPSDDVEAWDDLGAQISAQNRGFGLSLTFLY
jgi:hypothetical protein